MWQLHDGMGWWMALGSVWFIVFWAVVIWAVIKVTDKSDGRRDPGESAIEILRRRYASGEIDKEQFDQMRRDLGA